MATISFIAPHEVKQPNYLKVLIYGQPGIGKTTLALSAPRSLLIDIDDGQYRVDRLHRSTSVVPASWEQLLEIIDPKNKDQLKCFDSIVIDTIGKMMSLMDRSIINSNKKMGYLGSLSQQGYGLRKTIFKTFIDKLHSMNKHIIFVAHEQEKKQGEATVKRPEIGGSSSEDLMKELDLVGYFQAIGRSPIIDFARSDFYYTKNTFCLDESIVIEKPTSKESNNFLATVFDKVQLAIQQDKITEEKYTELMIEIAKVNSEIQTADDANQFMQWIKAIDHIWDSRDKSKLLMIKRCSVDLKFKYDKASGWFDPSALAEEPITQKTSEPNPTQDAA